MKRRPEVVGLHVECSMEAPVDVSLVDDLFGHGFWCVWLEEKTTLMIIGDRDQKKREKTNG